MKIETLIVADSKEFIPKYAHDSDACCYLRANLLEEKEIYISSGEIKKIDTGIKIKIPNGYEAQIRCRSGLACKGLMVVNGIGTIDSNYIGKIMVILTNISKKEILIKHLDKIAPMCIKPVWQFDFKEVKCLEETDRGESGFGSTG